MEYSAPMQHDNKRQPSTGLWRSVPLWLVGALLVCISPAALARDYQIEIALFEHVQAPDSVLPGELYYPKVTSAIGLNSDDATQAGFELVNEGLTLTANVESITRARRYRLLRHFAWRQPGLDAGSAQAIRVNLGETMSVYLPKDIGDYDAFVPASAQAAPDRQREITTTELNGTLKVRLGRFLHLESLLVYTDIKNQHSYRLSQSRKMRSRELHYIDNERFGLLVRILPIEETE